MKAAIWIIVIAVGLYVAYNLWSIFSTYRGMFAVEHYREVALTLEKLRRQAVLHPFVEDEGLALTEDPRAALTSHHLALAYTISREEGLFHHHLSVSTPRRGGTTHAAGETFVSFFVWRLGVKPVDCTTFFGPKAFHLQFATMENDQGAFMDRPLALSSKTDPDSIRSEVQRIRGQLEFFDSTPLIEAESEKIESGEG